MTHRHRSGQFALVRNGFGTSQRLPNRGMVNGGPALFCGVLPLMKWNAKSPSPLAINVIASLPPA